MKTVSRYSASALACLLLLCAAPCALGQYYGPASCAEADVETSVHFHQAPGDTQVVAMEYRNISGKTCVVSGFETQGDVGFEGWEYFEPVTRQKGGVIHSAFRWSTVGSRGACHPLQYLPLMARPLHNPLQSFFAPVVVPPVCSRLQQTQYLPGTAASIKTEPRDWMLEGYPRTA